MTVAFVTFGCRLNRAEALDLQTKFAAAGHQIVTLQTPSTACSVPAASQTSDRPDLIIVRGCSVTARAQRDCEKKIAHLRKLFPSTRVVAAGCLPNAENSDNVAALADGAKDRRHPQRAQPSAPPAFQPSRAYLKVQDGCSGRCAFCIVPRFRGAPRSEPFQEVLSRARRFLENGYREIVVTGCNLALYRSGGHGLPDLLAALATLQSSDLPNSHRIRLGSLEPGVCDAALLDAMEAHPNICRHVHLSLQSGSNAILKRMNRPYTIEQVAGFCSDAARRLGPRLALGADVICGFPGETETDFAATRAFLEAFTHLHAFPYSERPGTPAAEMDGALPRAVRLERVRILEEDAARRAEAFRASFKGQEVEICVEKDGTGYSGEYLRFPAPPGAARRSLVRVTP